MRTVTNDVSTTVDSTVVVKTGTGTLVVIIVTESGLAVGPLPSVVESVPCVRRPPISEVKAVQIFPKGIERGSCCCPTEAT